MNSQSNLGREKAGQEVRSSVDSNPSKINQAKNNQNNADNNTLEKNVVENEVVEGSFVENGDISEDSNPQSNNDPLLALYSLINELDVAELDVTKSGQPDKVDPSISLIAKSKQIALSKSDQNDASLKSPEEDIPEVPIIAELEAEELVSAKPINIESETTEPDSADSTKLEYKDDLYDRNYTSKIIKQDLEVDTSVSLLNVNEPDPELGSSLEVSPHWIIQKERQVNDLATSINSLLPFVVELSQAQIKISQEHILKNLVPIIDQVIRKRSAEDQQKMAEAIANILPKAIQQEIQQEPKLIGHAIAPELALSITEQIRLDEDAIAEALG